MGIKKTYSSVSACSDEQLQRLKSWIEASRAKIEWLLVVDPVFARGTETYQYHYVVPENRIITWTEQVVGYLLLQGCTEMRHWSHRSTLAFYALVTEIDCAGLVLEAWGPVLVSANLKEKPRKAFYLSLCKFGHVPVSLPL
jgi:hypothetical protein